MADETRSGRVLSVVGIFFSTFISYLACMPESLAPPALAFVIMVVMLFTIVYAVA
ncbi:MAG: hypothetical protein LQ340_002740 [Diploschistes diacapsis]|nr:MAG: hypothetical protein LQ340_002740 [Diploschistes diacapsis]